MSTKRHLAFDFGAESGRAIVGVIEDGKLKNVEYIGGCNGNLQGIGRLVEGMPVDEVISRLRGIRCGYKPTSCPDQLATALEQAKAKAAKA